MYQIVIKFWLFAVLSIKKNFRVVFLQIWKSWFASGIAFILVNLVEISCGVFWHNTFKSCNFGDLGIFENRWQLMIDFKLNSRHRRLHIKTLKLCDSGVEILTFHWNVGFKRVLHFLIINLIILRTHRALFALIKTILIAGTKLFCRIKNSSWNFKVICFALFNLL